MDYVCHSFPFFDLQTSPNLDDADLQRQLFWP